MTRSRLYLFDTTLRDGAQTQGVDFSLEDKRRIAATLDELGLDYIEGGYPGANKTDTEFFARAARIYLDELSAHSITEQVNEALETAGGDDSAAAAAQAGHRRLAAGDEW